MGCSVNFPSMSRMNAGGGCGAGNAQKLKQQESLRKQDDEREAEVITHENAHAAIAGGAPVYEYNERGKIVGGHVAVTLNPNSRTSLETAKAAAEAPGGGMSGQDASVAAQASQMLSALDAKASMGKAQFAMQNKRF
jgi:hypothetical protein